MAPFCGYLRGEYSPRCDDQIRIGGLWIYRRRPVPLASSNAASSCGVGRGAAKRLMTAISVATPRTAKRIRGVSSGSSVVAVAVDVVEHAEQHAPRCLKCQQRPEVAREQVAVLGAAGCPSSAIARRRVAGGLFVSAPIFSLTARRPYVARR